MARAKVNADTGLTDQQEDYAKNRAIYPKLSQIECYKDAYSAESMSYSSIAVEASKLEGNPKIALRISQIKQRVLDEAQVDAAYVLRRLVEIDQMDLLDIMDDNAQSFKPLSEWPKVWRQFLSGIDFSELWMGSGDEREIAGVLKKIKWPDKVKNLELIGKHVDVQAFKDKVETTHTVSDEMAELMKHISDGATG